MHTSTEDQPTAQAGRREWLGLLVLVLPAFLLSVDLFVLFLAIPHLAADLQPSSTQLLWISDIYGFMLAGLLVTMGTLGDRIGRRKLLLAGGAFFGIASVLAAFSTSPEMLIAARALLGLAGSTLLPSTLALIMNMFQNPKQRAVAVAVWSGCFMGGAALGPIIGGFMLSSFWWGSVFLLAVPVMALLLIAGPVLLPDYRNPAAGRLDLFSAGLVLAAVIPVIYGLKELARGGWTPAPVIAMVVGAAFGVLFIRRQRRLDDPLLDLGLFKIHIYRSAVLLGLLIGIIQGGALLFVTLQLQMVEGLSPLRAGFWLVPGALGTIVSIALSPGLARKIRPAYLMTAGLVVSAAGYVVLSQVPSTDGLTMVVVGFVLASAGVGPTVALGYNMILGSAPPEKTGSASALSETSGEFGLAAGIAFIGSIGTAIYRDQISVPAGVPTEAATAARESIAGAVDVAQRLSEPTAGELLASAREAFTSGLNLVGVLAAALFVVCAVLATVWLRQVPPIAGPEPEPEPEPTLTRDDQHDEADQHREDRQPVEPAGGRRELEPDRAEPTRES